MTYDVPRQGTVIPRGGPSLTAQAASVVQAGTDWAKTGFAFVSKQTLADRTAVCETCTEWDASAFNGTGRCAKCGCSTYVKLRLAGMKCPLGKW